MNTVGGCLWSCNFMISRKAFYSIGRFDEGFPYAAMEDIDLRERLRAAGHVIRFVPHATVDHPPRRMNGIEEWRRIYMSVAYYTVAKRGEKLRTWDLIHSTVKRGVREILRSPDRRDWFEASILLFRQLVMIVLCAKTWERKCRRPQRTWDSVSPQPIEEDVTDTK